MIPCMGVVIGVGFAFAAFVFGAKRVERWLLANAPEEPPRS